MDIWQVKLDVIEYEIKFKYGVVSLNQIYSENLLNSTPPQCVGRRKSENVDSSEAFVSNVLLLWFPKSNNFLTL